MEKAEKASKLVEKLFSQLIDQVEGIIDEEKKESHQNIAKSLESAFPAIEKKLNFPAGSVALQQILVQSGENFNHRSSNNQDNLSDDIVFLGARVKHEEITIECVRTLIINPTDAIKKAYSILLDLLQVSTSALQSGAPLSQVYIKTKEALKNIEPEYLKLFPPTIGSCNTKVISENSQEIAQTGEIYAIQLAFNNFPKPESFKCKNDHFSLVICDSAIVNQNGPVKILTEVARDYQDISYSLEDEEVATPKPKKEKIDMKELENRGVVRSSRLRHQINNQQLENEKRRKEHQNELRAKKYEELKQRFSRFDMGERDHSTDQRSLTEVMSYSSRDTFPDAAKKNQIFVDARHESVLVPIQGQIVPFHVSTIKNVSKNEEGSYFFLRINFLHPGAGIIKEGGYTLPDLKNPSTFYLKELTFRSSNPKNLNNAFRLLKELIKRVKVKEFEEIEKSSLVDQERLMIIKGKRPMLPDVTIRPNISGKKTQGSLEGHQNGLRFTSSKGEKLDIIYSNIKHAIFQPVENELIVLLHFHLHNSIMVGNKKTVDVQFYTEAGIQSDDLDMRRRGGMDLDEIQQEQREKKYKEKLNKEFKNFAEAVQALSNESVDFDIPYRELGFYGVPAKTNVFIMPSVNCLLSLVEQPFFVLSLNEIEVAHFERVQFALRNFDLVFVFKNYSKPPIRICTIPAEYLDPIKDWLNDIDIVYSESINPLNWGNVMKEISRDLQGFIEEGGWNFLQESEDEGQSEEEKEERGEEDEDSEFDEEELGSEEGESDFESDEESEEEEEESEESAESEDEEEEEGMDWDALEEEAKRQDAKRNAKNVVSAKSTKKTKH
ncbi:unnamed protein product [Blepharisma stoltei]|uniref:FACT complex subunit n=1 Tax=Blepharisma stoltei TaxID=1481888 RepID=A0AAU9K683_9CILI|nr:unnamed protein product [Blepharisma stoltei]